MKGIHQHIALLLASSIFLISFTVKFIFDIISVGLFFRDFVLFIGIYYVSNMILAKVEAIFVLTKKVVGE
jgi:hypothetical protein